MVYPLVALFFGTGNQTPNMSAAIVARVFNDPSLALFEYSPERLIDSEPTNFAFRNLQEFYNQKMRPYLEARGVRVLTSHRVEKVLKRSSDGVTLRISNLTNFEGVEYRAGGGVSNLGNSCLKSSRQEVDRQRGETFKCLSPNYLHIRAAPKCSPEGSTHLLVSLAQVVIRCCCPHRKQKVQRTQQVGTKTSTI